MTPEEREELVNHLEAKESGALAGQAQRQVMQNVQKIITAKKVSPKVLKVSPALAKKAITKLVITCTDSDGGLNFFVKGTVIGRYRLNETIHPAGSIDVGDLFYAGPQVENSDACGINVKITGGELFGDVVSYFDQDVYSVIGSCSDFYLKPGDTYTLGDVPNVGKKSDIGWIVKAVDCYVVEKSCSSLSFGQSYYPVASSTRSSCQYGCSKGACLPSKAVIQTK